MASTTNNTPVPSSVSVTVKPARDSGSNVSNCVDKSIDAYKNSPGFRDQGQGL